MQAEVKIEQQQQIINKLIEAINKNQFAEVKRIIDNIDIKLTPTPITNLVNQLNSQGLSPLYVACKNNNYEIANYLIDQGASISYDHKLIRFGAEQLSILDELAKHPDILIIEEIIQKELMVDKADVTGVTGEAGEADKIIDDIYSKDAAGKTFFHHIFENNNPEILEVILKNCDLNADKTLDLKDNKGLTPLECASPETIVTYKLKGEEARSERNRSLKLRILKFLNKNDKKSNILKLIEEKDITERDPNYEIFYEQFSGKNKNLFEQLKIFNILSLTSSALRKNVFSQNIKMKHKSTSPQKIRMKHESTSSQKKQLIFKESTDISIKSKILLDPDIYSLILPFLVKDLGGFFKDVGRFFENNFPKNQVTN
ncbi:MAG: ankyrin repeat domain-containing protein, partial [Alphaproteobacteria bacterium]